MSIPLDLALDPLTGDLEIPLRHVVDDVAGIAQCIRVAVGTVAGEWFRDLDLGLDWYGKVLGQRFDADAVQREFRRVIGAVTGVVQVLSLATSYDSPTRTLSVSWRVQVVADGVLSEVQDQISEVTP